MVNARKAPQARYAVVVRSESTAFGSISASSPQGQKSISEFIRRATTGVTNDGGTYKMTVNAIPVDPSNPPSVPDLTTTVTIRNCAAL
jgi:hypothetical protein